MIEKELQQGKSRVFSHLVVITLAVCMAGCHTFVQKEQSKEEVGRSPQQSQIQGNVVKQTNPLPSPVLKKPIFQAGTKYQGKTLYKLEAQNTDKIIALTFDDGPWTKTTDQILHILQQNNVKATFFWVGKSIQAHPEIAQRVVAQGHAIGNHTWHHWYRQMDTATAKQEIDRTSELIYKTTGVKTFLFRPPGGYLNNGLVSYAQSQKYTVVMWSQTSADTDPRAKYQVFVKNVLRDAKPGGIVLMHDGGGDRARTVQALPQIISGLKAQGYRFVTIPELLEN